MISNTELRKQMKKDGLNLDDNQLNIIRTFLVQMATIEYNQYREQKVRFKIANQIQLLNLANTQINFI